MSGGARHTGPQPHWTAAENARLRELVAKGDSSTQIAEAMGRTRNAIVGRCMRMKLQLKGTSGGASPKFKAAIAARKADRHRDLAEAAQSAGEEKVAQWHREAADRVIPKPRLAPKVVTPIPPAPVAAPRQTVRRMHDVDLLKLFDEKPGTAIRIEPLPATGIAASLGIRSYVREVFAIGMDGGETIRRPYRISLPFVSILGVTE